MSVINEDVTYEVYDPTVVNNLGQGQHRLTGGIKLPADGIIPAGVTIILETPAGALPVAGKKITAELVIAAGTKITLANGNAYDDVVNPPRQLPLPAFFKTKYKLVDGAGMLYMGHPSAKTKIMFDPPVLVKITVDSGTVQEIRYLNPANDEAPLAGVEDCLEAGEMKLVSSLPAGACVTDIFPGGTIIAQDANSQTLAVALDHMSNFGVQNAQAAPPPPPVPVPTASDSSGCFIEIASQGSSYTTVMMIGGFMAALFFGLFIVAKVGNRKANGIKMLTVLVLCLSVMAIPMGRSVCFAAEPGTVGAGAATATGGASGVSAATIAAGVTAAAAAAALAAAALSGDDSGYGVLGIATTHKTPPPEYSEGGETTTDHNIPEIPGPPTHSSVSHHSTPTH
jgi:hypothetical protein